MRDRGVDVEDGAADEAEYRDQCEWHQEPGRKQGGQRADRVGCDGSTQLCDEPASISPKINSTTGPSDAPKVVQPTTPALEDAGASSGNSRWGVDPSSSKPVIINTKPPISCGIGPAGSARRA